MPSGPLEKILFSEPRRRSPSLNEKCMLEGRLKLTARRREIEMITEMKSDYMWKENKKQKD
jgi:hypothetical protein